MDLIIQSIMVARHLCSVLIFINLQQCIIRWLTFHKERFVVKDTKKNPKRAQRDAKKQTLETGIGTKSQQALKLQQEQNKQERKVRSREQREAESQRIFELKKIKKREKHRGH